MKDRSVCFTGHRIIPQNELTHRDMETSKQVFQLSLEHYKNDRGSEHETAPFFDVIA